MFRYYFMKELAITVNAGICFVWKIKKNTGDDFRQLLSLSSRLSYLPICIFLVQPMSRVRNRLTEVNIIWRKCAQLDAKAYKKARTFFDHISYAGSFSRILPSLYTYTVLLHSLILFPPAPVIEAFCFVRKKTKSNTKLKTPVIHVLSLYLLVGV